MPEKVVWVVLVALLLGCDERERLTFPNDPDDTVGPTSRIDQPSQDTTLNGGQSFVIGARTVDSSGVDTVYITVDGANLGYPPIAARGDVSVSFAFTFPTSGLSGRTVTVGVYGVDMIGNPGTPVSRRLTIE